MRTRSKDEVQMLRRFYGALGVLSDQNDIAAETNPGMSSGPLKTRTPGMCPSEDEW